MMKFLKKLGGRTIGFVLVLLLIVMILYLFYRDNLIGIHLFCIVSIMSLALAVINGIDRFRLLETEAKKFIKKGDELYKKGELKGALSRYEEALFYYEQSFGAEMGLGHCYRNLNQFEKSAEHFKKASQINSASSQAPFFAGIAYQKAGFPQKAEIEFLRAVNISEDQTEAYLHLGDIYFQQGNDSESLRMYEKFIQNSPEQSATELVRAKYEKIRKIVEQKQSLSQG